jgi:hypothetical protein
MQIKEKRGDEIKNKIFSSETAEPISTKFAEMILKFGCDWLSSFRVEDFFNFLAPFF